MRALADEQEQRYGFPGAFGFIDGTHMESKGRGEDRESYINRMGFSSMLAQATCDVNMRYIHINMRWPGSVHAARMFRNSTIQQLLPTLPEDLHVLGDTAFPLSSTVLPPYKSPARLTVKQTRYNHILGSARQTVERSFVALKGKFRRLQFLDMDGDVEISNVHSEFCEEARGGGCCSSPGRGGHRNPNLRQ